MNKADLIEMVAGEIDESKAGAERAVNAVRPGSRFVDTRARRGGVITGRKAASLLGSQLFFLSLFESTRPILTRAKAEFVDGGGRTDLLEK